MIFFIFAIVLHSYCAVSLSTSEFETTIWITTSRPSSTSSATTALSTFWWSEHRNDSSGGYYPQYPQCPMLGTTCEEACGVGVVECGSSGMCYFPDLGDQCCSEYSGVSCWTGYRCAETKNDYLCCSDDETEDECASLEGKAVRFLTPVSNPTSLPPSTVTIYRPSMVWSVKTEEVTVTAGLPKNTASQSGAAEVLAPSASSSSSRMTTRAKIGVGISVPCAILALGLLGAFMWLRRTRTRPSQNPTKTAPWESDVQNSQSTLQNEKLPENSNDGGTYSRVSHEPEPPRSSYLQVSPLSSNRRSTVTSSANSLSPNVNYAPISSSPNSTPPATNYTPIPFNDLPELVDGPSR